MSSVPVPLDGRGDSLPVESPHVAATSFDLSWPGGGNISTALGRTLTGPFCVTTYTLSLPKNVSALFGSEDEGLVDCGPVLGRECVDIIGRGVLSKEVCPSPVTEWHLIPECRGIFDQVDPFQHPFVRLTSTWNLNPVQGVRPTTNGTGTNGTADGEQTLLSGGAFFVTMPTAFDGSNTTAYEDATNQLRVLLVDGTQAPAGQPSGTALTDQKPQVLCMRVNTSSSFVE